MVENKKDKTFSDYIGIMRSVTPGIKVTNLFLSYFFGCIKKEKSEAFFDTIFNLKVEDINGISCKEQDNSKREKLSELLQEWLKSYMIYKYDPNDKKAYKPENIIPLHEEMIFKDFRSIYFLKDIFLLLLYYEVSDAPQLYRNDREKLINYLYSHEDRKNFDFLLYKTIDNIYITVKEKVSSVNYIQRDFENEVVSSKAYTNRLNDAPLDISANHDIIKNSSLIDTENVENYYVDAVKEIKVKFRGDFDALMECKSIKNMSVYNKIYYLTVLLNFYIIQYMLIRVLGKKDPYMLCQGNAFLSNDSFHTACVDNYNFIRESTRDQSVEFLKETLKDYFKGKKVSREKTNFAIIDNKLYIERKDLPAEEFQSFMKNYQFTKGRPDTLDKLEKEIKSFFVFKDGKANIEYDKFAEAISHFHKKRSTFIDQTVQIFSTQGREAELVFPANQARQKYFALSLGICDLLLRLYLEKQKKEEDIIENFISSLENDYRIAILNSEQLSRFLKNSYIKVPSNEDFNENFNAFLSTLEEINAVKKKSDTSYLVTIPGRAGGN